MLERGPDVDLAQEALDAEVHRELGEQHLHRDALIAREIAGEVDRRHPAAPELALEYIAPRERRLERRDRLV
jgi:hypothetical protein